MCIRTLLFVALTRLFLVRAQSQAALPSYGVYYPKAKEAAAAAARGVPPPHLPPPDGWEAAAAQVERGAAEAEARAVAAEEPYFDASETLPTDELITSGVPLPVRTMRDVNCAPFFSPFPHSHFSARAERICGASTWQDAVTGVVRAPPSAEATSGGRDTSGDASGGGSGGGASGGGGPREKVLHQLDALSEAVLHAAERAAEALRIASEDGTRGTP